MAALLGVLHIRSVKANITPHLENPQVGQGPSEETISSRLERLLDGRSPWKWAERVQLNAGTIGRMLKNNKLPDPAALVPAMRIENLSLNWLLDGMGKPHPVAVPVDDAEATQWISSILDEDMSAEVLVVYCSQGFTPVLHARVQAESKAGAYTYRSTTIIGGAPGKNTIAAIQHYAEQYIDKRGETRIRSIEVRDTIWHQLASGELGNYALFGEDGKGGLYAESRFEMGTTLPGSHLGGRKVAEDRALWLDDTQRQAQAAFAALTPAERKIVLKMLHGLRSPD